MYIYKMDAVYNNNRKDRISRRKERWSMFSQRLNEIVAELMRPLGHKSYIFDKDFCALLEEYLTEAGIRALDAEESGLADSAHIILNYTELALLVQQSASLYGLKVDCLYNEVAVVYAKIKDNKTNASETANTPSNSQSDEPQTPSTVRRKRKSSMGVDLDFVDIKLEICTSAKMDMESLKAPPTLPRMYIELEPRVLSEEDKPLLDYSGEPIGLLSDYHVMWRLQEGVLVEELETVCARSAESPLLALPLLELHSVIAAATPPLPSPREDSPPPDPPPATSTPMPRAPSTPLPHPSPAATAETIAEAVAAMQPPTRHTNIRKRNSDTILDHQPTAKLLIITEETARALRLSPQQDFRVRSHLRRTVLRRRISYLRQIRIATILAEVTYSYGFRGYNCGAVDIGGAGFRGWSVADAKAAISVMNALQLRLSEPESDDDGFFERSSLGESDGSHYTEKSEVRIIQKKDPPWSALSALSEVKSARKPPDLQQLAANLLGQLPDSPTPFHQVLTAWAAHPRDVPAVALTTLFLTNAGSVMIVREEDATEQSSPTTLRPFTVQRIGDMPATLQLDFL